MANISQIVPDLQRFVVDTHRVMVEHIHVTGDNLKQELVARSPVDTGLLRSKWVSVRRVNGVTVGNPVRYLPVLLKTGFTNAVERSIPSRIDRMLYLVKERTGN